MFVYLTHLYTLVCRLPRLMFWMWCVGRKKIGCRTFNGMCDVNDDVITGSDDRTSMVRRIRSKNRTMRNSCHTTTSHNQNIQTWWSVVIVVEKKVRFIWWSKTFLYIHSKQSRADRNLAALSCLDFYPKSRRVGSFCSMRSAPALPLDLWYNHHRHCSRAKVSLETMLN